MAIKNRPTLLQQFTDFINRNPPFDGNPLIQDSEHLQVETDYFDSVLLKQDEEQNINSPADTFAVDFATFDLYNVDTTGSIDTDFTITINNLSTGQIGRIAITKKNNDTITFANASLTTINNLNQFGGTINFYIINIGGNLIVLDDLVIAKSDAINENNPDQLATSKAVNDLNAIKANIIQSVWQPLTLLNGAIDAPDIPLPTPRRVPSFYKDNFGRVWLTGIVDAGSSGVIANLPVGNRPLIKTPISFGHVDGLDQTSRIETNGDINIVTNIRIFLDGVSFTTQD